ncbi:MAG: AarF/UbiB family protein [Gemmatimonadota bacterium]|nr:AarF/UbiB family protein [Gemmatimonadota bacterium]
MILAPRYLPRLAATVGLFTRYGLKDFANRQGLQALAPDEVEPAGSTSEETGQAERAVAFRKRLVELGPAYVKLGQVLSTRPDLIPSMYIEELERLQDDVGEIPYADVERTVQEELGARISKLFRVFEEKPIGTASLGQVHGAELRDGRSVVVKVQRPGIRELLADDLEFFNQLAQFLTEHTDAGARIDIVGIIQQLERALSDELDYRIEARNAASFRRSLAQFPHLLIPRMIEGYTSQRVLTSERIRGVKMDEIPPIARMEHDFARLADEFAKAYLKQITVDGHFHADPHPGNVFVVLPGRENPNTPSQAASADRRLEVRPASTPLAKIEQEAQAEAPRDAEETDVKLALIDFGMTAHLSNSLREHMVRVLLDLADNRGDAVAETLIEMGTPVDELFERAGYIREIASLVSRNYDRAVGEIHAGTLIYELINISYQKRLRLPAELTLLAKALFNLDAVSRALDPSFSPFAAVRKFGNHIATERMKRELSSSRMYQVLTQASDLVSVLPRRLDQITALLAANDFGVRVDAPQLPVLLSGMQKIANRVFSGLVLAGLLIASAMLLPYRRVLGTSGFLVAAGVAVYMVVSILMTDRPPKRG